tara:strand:+ start:3395 stop:3922 length:528 start_codon:yes stop_codon:yes gene_type:complete
MKLVYLTPKKVTLVTSDLTSTEQLLLWSLRTWVLGYIRKAPVQDDISRAYSHYKVPEASTLLAHFMYALSFGAKRTIDISCPLKSGLSPDELTLLNIFSNFQAGNMSLACCMLNDFCDEKYIMQARYLALEFTRLTGSQGNMTFSLHRLDNCAPCAVPATDQMFYRKFTKPSYAI